MNALKSTASFPSAKSQGGFTLIELVMVIVILGILSAFALPRFADVSTDARKATVNALAGSIKSAASISHSAQIATGASLGTDATMDGVAVKMVNGYPQANAVGIGAAANIDSNDYTVAAGGATGGTSVVISKVGAPDTTKCNVTYTAAKAATDNKAPLTAPFTVSVLTTGC
jgi:MSHA pilin protein MshA